MPMLLASSLQASNFGTIIAYTKTMPSSTIARCGTRLAKANAMPEFWYDSCKQLNLIRGIEVGDAEPYSARPGVAG